MTITDIKKEDITNSAEAMAALKTIFSTKEVASQMLDGYGERTDFPEFNATRNAEGNKMMVSFSKDETEPTFPVDVAIFNKLMEEMKVFAVRIIELAEAREKEVVAKFNSLINS